MIVVVPMAGLANRLRVIDSAIALSKEINQKVEVYWTVIPGELNCRFHYLFKDLIGIEVKTFNLLLPDTFPSNFPLFIKNQLNRYLVKNKFDYLITNSNAPEINTDRNAFLKQIKKCENIYIRTWERFLPAQNMNNTFFPLDLIKTKVLDYQKMFSSSYSGFHIRRNDNFFSCSKSPVYLFEKYIRSEIEIGNKVFLTTDSIEVEKQLQNRFGRNIFTTNKSFTRNTIQGIQDALVDFLLLADSNTIYGSYWSSFSEEASLFKSKPLIIIKEDI